MSAAPWTDAHRREARARLLELGAEVIRSGRVDLKLANESPDDWTLDGLLRGLKLHGFDALRICRELRMIRARAEGRVEETVRWTAGGTTYATKEQARKIADEFLLPLVKVTRRRIRPKEGA